MENTGRGSKSPTKSQPDSIRQSSSREPSPSRQLSNSSPPSPKQSTLPNTPEPGQSNLSNRERGRYGSGRASASVQNFLLKNRQACKKCYTATGVPRMAGDPTPVKVSLPPRTKPGQAPVIGDEIGTPSNKGSSFFMGAGHNGVREPLKRTAYKRSMQSSQSSQPSQSSHDRNNSSS